MINTIEEFRERFLEIKAMGWVQTHRAGNTGIGKTLEDLLEIPENNTQGPDFGQYELKAGRLNSNSMLTLFTKSPSPRGSNTRLRLMYGYSSDTYQNDEKVLHATLNAASFVTIAKTNNQLKVECVPESSPEFIYIVSQQGRCDAYWSVKALNGYFSRKYPRQLVYVKADFRGTGANEEFLFKEAYLCDDFSYDSFIELLKTGKIYVDLRIGQYRDGRTHDHGTGFRIRENDQDLLFHKQRID